tara:strand:+ start:39891 stop:40067 length:177 start_codon:yes stop_codon:yes gene_type:complete
MGQIREICDRDLERVVDTLFTKGATHEEVAGAVASLLFEVKADAYRDKPKFKTRPIGR